jgi:hypothetical protein
MEMCSDNDKTSPRYRKFEDVYSNLLLLIQCGEPSLKQRQSEDLRASRSE